MSLPTIARRTLAQGASVQSASSTPALAVAAAVARRDASRSRKATRTPETSCHAGGSCSVPRVRAFHSSSVNRQSERGTSFQKRREDLPVSSWSRPPRPSQDADDDVVPTYYIERKKQRETISQRKEEEGSLMAELNAGILSEGLAAATRAREEKIPVEVRLPDGSVSHPSGFEPPTAETEFHPVAAKVATEDHPLLSTVKQPWDEREFVEAGADPIEPCPVTEAEWIKRMIESGGGSSLSAVQDLGAETSSASESRSTRTSAWDPPAPSRSTHDPDSVVPQFYVERKKMRAAVDDLKGAHTDLMHELNANILADDVAAHIMPREEKIPVEITLEDGTVAHPSGFVPPTGETEFHPIAAKSGDEVKQPWTEVLATKVPEESRGLHTSAAVRDGIWRRRGLGLARAPKIAVRQGKCA